MGRERGAVVQDHIGEKAFVSLYQTRADQGNGKAHLIGPR